MGICYAIAHPASGECFDLGKGPWYEWRGCLPASLDDVRRAFVYAFVDRYKGELEDADPGRLDDARMCSQADAVWSFLHARPGCVIVDDHHDDFWSRTERPDDDKLREGGSRVWRQVGSIYDPRPDFIAGKPVPQTGGEGAGR